MRGFINIALGLVFIGGGLSGRLALIGTNSPEAIAALGLVPLSLGVYQLYRQYKRKS